MEDPHLKFHGPRDNLAIGEGWVNKGRGEDRKTIVYTVTRAGQEQLDMLEGPLRQSGGGEAP